MEEESLVAGQEGRSSPSCASSVVINTPSTLSSTVHSFSMVEVDENEQQISIKRSRTISDRGKLIKFYPQQFKKRSAVWNHFLIYEKDRETANCKHCKIYRSFKPTHGKLPSRNRRE